MVWFFLSIALGRRLDIHYIVFLKLEKLKDYFGKCVHYQVLLYVILDCINHRRLALDTFGSRINRFEFTGHL